MRERLMRRLREEDGMTLTEMLVAMVIMTIVCLVTFGLVEVVMKKTGDIASRTDTTQRARTAMDQITRQLRSQVCAYRSDKTTDGFDMNAARSLESASPTQLSVFVDFSDESAKLAPELHTLTWAPDANQAGKAYPTGTITEKVVKGTWTTDNKVTYTYGTATLQAANTSTRQLLTNVAPLYYLDGSAKTKPVIFRYYEYSSTTSAFDAELGTSGTALAPADLVDVAKININFRTMPTNGGEKSGVWSDLTDDVFLRTTDPNAATPDPTCLTY